MEKQVIIMACFFIYHSVLLADLQEDLTGYYQYPSSFPYLKDLTRE